MGLEDFMDLDVDEDDTSESTKENNSESELLKYDNWTKGENGRPEKRGPYGYGDREEYNETIVGDLEIHGNMFKYNLPIFPHIEIGRKYERGNRYEHETKITTVTCMSHERTRLRKVNREVIMLDTGHTEKEECLNILSERFDRDIGPRNEVHLYFFGYMRHIVKMAMADEFVDDWGLRDKDRVLKAVYGESYTQRFREKDTGERDLKGLDEMEKW